MHIVILSGHWAEETIEKMDYNNIIEGYPDDTMKPDKEITRAEFITIINKLLNLSNESNKYIPDVTRQDWFYSEIRKAVDVGIVLGDQNGYIHPNDNITREEAVVILARAFKKETIVPTKKFSDEAEISDWAKSDFMSFVEHEYIEGYEDGTLKPKNELTRAEALTIINRVVPNVLSTGVYDETSSKNIYGSALIKVDNVTLKNLTIDGDLIITNNASMTFQANNVTVRGNIILVSCDDLNLSKIKDYGTIYTINTLPLEEESYINTAYGIKFGVPQAAVVKEMSSDEEIDYLVKDLIVIDIKKSDEYYLKNVKTIARSESRRYDNKYAFIENGKIDMAEYVLYDDKESSQMIVIKRNNVVYTLLFFNVVSDNYVENVLSTIELLEGPEIVDAENIVYKNSSLALKFVYKNYYIAVDDSYNTGKINTQEAPFKLFIQVNQITDMQNYDLAEIKELLKSLVRNDGKILNTDTFKISNNDAIQFKIQNDQKLIYSLYIIVGNNLYNFIYTGEEVAMTEVGEDLFNDFVRTIEF